MMEDTFKEEKEEDFVKDTKKYLTDINVPEVTKERVFYFLREYKEIMPEDENIDSIFITDQIDVEGKRLLQNLWFFSKTYIMEIKDFQSKNLDKMDLNKLDNQVIYVEITKNYSFNPTEVSSEVLSNPKAHVYFKLNSDIGGELDATGENCKYLSKIIKERLTKNFYS